MYCAIKRTGLAGDIKTCTQWIMLTKQCGCINEWYLNNVKTHVGNILDMSRLPRKRFSFYMEWVLPCWRHGEQPCNWPVAVIIITCFTAYSFQPRCFKSVITDVFCCKPPAVVIFRIQTYGTQANRSQYDRNENCYPVQNTIENVMDLMVLMGIALVLMITIMLSTGMWWIYWWDVKSY